MDPIALLEDVPGWGLVLLEEGLELKEAWQDLTRVTVSVTGKPLYSATELAALHSQPHPGRAVVRRLVHRGTSVVTLLSLLHAAGLHTLHAALAPAEVAQITHQSVSGKVLVVAGDTVKVSVTVKGNPPPLVVWYKGDHPLLQHINKHTLCIDNCGPDDEGVYICLVRQEKTSPGPSNVFASTVTSAIRNSSTGTHNNADIGVDPADNFSDIKSCSDVTIIESANTNASNGDKNNIDDNINNGNDTKKNNKNYTISDMHIDSVDVMNSDNITNNTSISDNISDASNSSTSNNNEMNERGSDTTSNRNTSSSSSDNSNASNTSSNSSDNSNASSGYVEVWGDPVHVWLKEAPPVICEHPSDCKIKWGEEAVLKCGVKSAFPPPVFAWYKDGHHLVTSDNSSLTLRQVDGSSAGVFWCVAHSTAGTATSRHATLEVIGCSDGSGLPTIILQPCITTTITTTTSCSSDEPSGTASVRRGQPLQLWCSVRCSLPVSFTWVRSGTALEGNIGPNHKIMSSTSDGSSSSGDVHDSSLQYTPAETDASPLRLLCVAASPLGQVTSIEVSVALREHPSLTPKVYTAWRKWALLVGNRRYGARRLYTTLSDGQAFARALTHIGFRCLVLADLTLTHLRNAINLLASYVEEGDYVVFYYAGHGYYDRGGGCGGGDRIIPIDAYDGGGYADVSGCGGGGGGSGNDSGGGGGGDRNCSGSRPKFYHAGDGASGGGRSGSGYDTGDGDSGGGYDIGGAGGSGDDRGGGDSNCVGYANVAGGDGGCDSVGGSGNFVGGVGSGNGCGGGGGNNCGSSSGVQEVSASGCLPTVWVRNVLLRRQPALLFIVLDMCRTTLPQPQSPNLQSHLQPQPQPSNHHQSHLQSHAHHQNQLQSQPSNRCYRPVEHSRTAPPPDNTPVELPVASRCSVLLHATAVNYAALEAPRTSSVLARHLLRRIHSHAASPLRELASTVLEDMSGASGRVRSQQIPELKYDLALPRTLADAATAPHNNSVDLWNSMLSGGAMVSAMVQLRPAEEMVGLPLVNSSTGVRSRESCGETDSKPHNVAPLRQEVDHFDQLNELDFENKCKLAQRNMALKPELRGPPASIMVVKVSAQARLLGSDAAPAMGEAAGVAQRQDVRAERGGVVANVAEVVVTVEGPPVLLHIEVLAAGCRVQNPCGGGGGSKLVLRVEDLHCLTAELVVVAWVQAKGGGLSRKVRLNLGFPGLAKANLGLNDLHSPTSR